MIKKKNNNSLEQFILLYSFHLKLTSRFTVRCFRHGPPHCLKTPVKKKKKVSHFLKCAGLFSEVHFILTKWGGSLSLPRWADGTINQGSRCRPVEGRPQLPLSLSDSLRFAENLFRSIVKQSGLLFFYVYTHHTSPLGTVISIKTTRAHQPTAAIDWHTYFCA